MKIPHPQTPKVGSRVYDFEVVLRVGGKDVLRRLVLANGFNVPEAQANRVTNCLFGADETVLRAASTCPATVWPAVYFTFSAERDLSKTGASPLTWNGRGATI